MTEKLISMEQIECIALDINTKEYYGAIRKIQVDLYILIWKLSIKDLYIHFLLYKYLLNI